MKDLMERLVTLPFAAGCVSQSSIAVVRNQPKKFQPVQPPPTPPPPPPAQLFIYREGDVEVEMEIGFPTNVQHVAHVGWGGSDGTGVSMKSWDEGASDLFTLPSLSLAHLELAMPSRDDASVQCSSLRFT